MQLIGYYFATRKRLFLEERCQLFRLLIKGTVSRYIFNLRPVEIHKLSTNSFLKEQYNKMFSEIRTAYHEDT